MEKVIQQYRNRVFGFLLKYVKIPEVAEDLTQDVMVKLWRNRQKITAPRLLSLFVPESIRMPF